LAETKIINSVWPIPSVQNVKGADSEFTATDQKT